MQTYLHVSASERRDPSALNRTQRRLEHRPVFRRGNGKILSMRIFIHKCRVESWVESNRFTLVWKLPFHFRYRCAVQCEEH